MNRLLFSGCLLAAMQSLSAAPVEPRDTTKVVDVEEIVIVASPKENTKFRQQALSSSVFSREQLHTNQVTSIKNVTSLVPNFYMPDYGSKLTSAVYIRGIGSRINTPAVGLYVDNIPYLDKSAFDFNLYDIERIDVLRGPQSTLYGRNAMGGLMRIYTRNPFRYQGTQASLGFSSGNNSYRASLAHYHRISERFAFSAGGFYEGARGFFKNTLLNKYADPLQSGGGRLRAIWLPTDRWKIDFTANYEYSDEGGYAYSLYNPETGVTDPIQSGEQGKYRRGLFNTGVAATYQADNFIFNSVTSYQRLDDRMYIDQDFLPEEKYTLEQKQRLNAFTEELSVKSLPGKRWQWVNGLFASWQGLRTQSPVHFRKDGMTMLQDMINSNLPSKMPMSITFKDDALPIYSGFDTPVTSMALFHQSTINDLLIDGLSLTVGLRLDHERLSMDYRSAASSGYDFAIKMFPVQLSNTAVCDLKGSVSDHYTQLLPKFSLKYDFDAQNNVYATVSKGYRSGGYNIQMFSDLARNSLQGSMMMQVKQGCFEKIDQMAASGMLPMPAEVIKQLIETNMPKVSEPDVRSTYYKPEYSWSYEVGTHLTLFDGRLQADMSAFLMDTRDQQIARMIDSGLGRAMVNAGRSRSMGVEAALSASINSHLNLNASYGYTRATFRDYDAGQDADKQTIDYSGNTVPFVPRHTLHVGASYAFFLKNTCLHQIVLHAGYTGAGDVYWSEANDMKQSFYGLYNGSVLLRMKHFDIDIWSRNIAGKDYRTFGVESMGHWFVQKGKPRQFGVDIRFNI